MQKDTENKETDQNEGFDQNENLNNENDIFHVDFEDEEAVDDEWLESLEGNIEDENTLEEDNDSNDDNDSDDDNNDGDELNLDNIEEEENNEEDNDDLNLEAFNKKLGKDFKTQQELIDFLKEKDNEEEVVDDDKIIEESNAAIDYYSPLLKLNDKELMLKQAEAEALSKGKDINDAEVQEEIEDKVQEMIDSYDLSLKARALRDNLEKLVKEAVEKKDNVIKKQERIKNESIAKSKEELQNSFANIHSKKTFFGIDTDKETITRAYKKAQSGKFIEELQADKNKLAEAAMLMEMKEKIHKKSSGLSYSDGIKAALDEYKKSKDDKSITKAQRNGSNGSSSNSKNLVNAFIQ